MSIESLKETCTELEKDTITISKFKFLEIVAKVLNKEPFDSLAKGNPILVLAFAIFGAELCKELFDKKEEREMEEQA